MLDNYYAVIMAGGGGTRLWPLSRKERPKQMLSLFDECTLFQTAVRRLDGVFPPERIFVVTVQAQAGELHAQMPEIPFENFLIEPLPRGTASVVGLAAIALAMHDPKAVMVVLTADHYIAHEDVFRKLLECAHDVAEDGYLVTLGIAPTFAATGFGYIQQGEPLPADGGFNVFHVRRFIEKPEPEQARQMVSQPHYSWNSGMFVWRVDRILEEFKQHMPDFSDSLRKISDSWQGDIFLATLEKVWHDLKSETIDYGIMEKADKVVVIQAAGLGWSDVGSWDSLYDVLDGDEDGNIVMGRANHMGLDTTNTLVCAEGGPRLVVTIGVENLVLVDTGDVLFVCNKNQAQRVRQVVNELKVIAKDLI